MDLGGLGGTSIKYDSIIDRDGAQIPENGLDSRDVIGTKSQQVDAARNSDRRNARIEHDNALRRVMTAMMKDDTERFRQFMDNDSFRRWMADTVFELTCQGRGDEVRPSGR